MPLPLGDENAPPWNEDENARPVLHPGMRIDLLDTEGRWYEAEVELVDNGSAQVTFVNWTRRWDEVSIAADAAPASLSAHSP